MTLEPLRPLDILVISLALIALGFAIKQYLDARGAKRDARGLEGKVVSLSVDLHVMQVKVASQSLELKKIIEQSSTRAIPRFPDNVPAVCRLLDSCTEKTIVKIMVDYIGYTLYSERSNFDVYLDSMKNAIARGVKIRLLVYDFSRAKRAICNQYPSISEEREKDRFADLFKRLQKPTATNEKEFYRALLLAEESLYQEIKGVEMKLLTEEPPALFWLKDDPDSIVFSFRDEFPGTGFSFASEDSNLAAQFDVMFNTHWERGEEHWDCRW